MFMAGILRPLIGIENLWYTIGADGFFEYIGSQCRIHSVRELPRQDRFTAPVNNGSEIDKAAMDTYIGDIVTPYLVRSIDFQFT